MVAVTTDTTVQEGGIIHIHSDRLPPGARAHVVITIDELPPSLTSPLLPTMASLIGAATGGFKTSAQADAHLHAERDSWQR